jgi:hypothetical protein
VCYICSVRACIYVLLTVACCAPACAQDEEPIAKFGTTVVLNSGFHGLVYHIRADSDRLPNFKKLKPVGTIYAHALNMPPQHFTTGFPGVTKRFEWFAIDYTARFWIDKPGVYRFSLISDDGSKLYIDDKQLIDDDGIHSAQRADGLVDLSGGVHDIRVSYFQGPRDELALILQVAGPGERLRIFDTNEFKPPPDAGSFAPPAPANPPVKK